MNQTPAAAWMVHTQARRSSDHHYYYQRRNRGMHPALLASIAGAATVEKVAEIVVDSGDPVGTLKAVAGMSWKAFAVVSGLSKVDFERALELVQKLIASDLGEITRDLLIEYLRGG